MLFWERLRENLPYFLEGLIRDHKAGHPGYYGYVIWDLVILEEWMKAQRR